jgi:hypothetical protein
VEKVFLVAHWHLARLQHPKWYLLMVAVALKVVKLPVVFVVVVLPLIVVHLIVVEGPICQPLAVLLVVQLVKSSDPLVVFLTLVFWIWHGDSLLRAYRQIVGIATFGLSLESVDQHALVCWWFAQHLEYLVLVIVSLV